MPNAFITGVAGFVGTHLCDLLQSRGYTVYGVDTAPQWQWDGVRYTQVDICDFAAMSSALSKAAPDQVYHLAGVSFPPDAEASPRNSLQINVMGCVALLDAVRETCPKAVCLLVGSSKVYEAGTTDSAVDESSPVSPSSFYAISKYAAELIGTQFSRQMGLDVRFTRSFNHTGPGQSPRFVCSDWARQIARISCGKQDAKVTVGDLSPEIDFCDVRDVVRAYGAIVEGGKNGAVYNVCSGRAVALRYVLDYLLAKAGKTVTVTEDDTKKRGHGPSRRIEGDNTRLTSDTDWRPEYPIERTLDDLFAYWRIREA